MKHLIRKCPKCASYTLKHGCEKCKIPTIDAHPAKYSPDDKYARYRIADRYIPSEKMSDSDPLEVDK
ncbi:MAG TPA: RNA-protein complex protein Nop10 [Candidatus Nitrosopolaris sp.]|nr:RNA-protein complex protein Nop10 [Candidatus Nitrosopolaris sp.]